MVLQAMQYLKQDETKDDYVESIKLISMVALLNDHLSVKWSDLCKQESVGLLKSYNELVTCSEFYFFAGYLKMKLPTSKQFKIRSDSNLVMFQALGQGVMV